MKRTVILNASQVESSIKRLKDLEGVASRALANLDKYTNGRRFIRVPGISDSTASELARLRRNVREAGRQTPQTPSLERPLSMMPFRIPKPQPEGIIREKRA